MRRYMNPEYLADDIEFLDENIISGAYVPPGCKDAEFAQLTKLKSVPHKHVRRVLPEETASLVSPVHMMLGRECNYSGRGRFSLSDSCHVLSRFLPVRCTPSVVDKMNSRAYVSQFSDDGSLFFAGFQKSHIKIYDVDRGWKVHKDIRAWSLKNITDTCLSPDRRFLIYSSISPIVHIVDVGSATKESHANVTEIHEGLELSSNDDDYHDYSHGIFSVKFSTDGREIVAASSDDAIYVYDLEARKLSLRIEAHRADVNSVCFADESGNIIYSGSDDNLCKVWDRRCLATEGKAAGVLMGHLEGITFIDTRGDGRYFISNGKDQSIKLWDIRKMSSNYVPRIRYLEWNYRWMEFPEKARNMRLRNDLSIATYKGHTVLRTLIRCYFSPAYSTGQRYIYTGSTDGCVYIYDVLSGDQVAKLDFHEDPVRDCNWHPFYPMLVTSSWDGTIARWEFPDNRESTAPARPVRRRRF